MMEKTRVVIDAIAGEDDTQGVRLGEARLDYSPTSPIWHVCSNSGAIVGYLLMAGPPDMFTIGGANSWNAIEWQGSNQVRVAEERPFGEAIDALIGNLIPEGYTHLRMRTESYSDS